MLRSQTAKSRLAATSSSASGPPELLSQLPGSLYTSPVFILGVVAAEFAYGFVLFVVLMAHKPDPNAVNVGTGYVPYTGASRSRLVASATSPFPPSAPHEPEPTIIVKKTEPTTPPGEADQAEPPKAKAKVAEKKKGGAGKSKAARKKDAPAPTSEVALLKTTQLTDPAPAPAPPPVASGSPVGPFAAFDDPMHDCQVQWDNKVLTMTVPGTMHALNPMFDLKDAPRALSPVQGDFIVQVRIAPTLKPGSKPLLPTLPFAYQGAGLLLWQDDRNFVRLERAAQFTLSEQGGLSQKVLIETYKDGKSRNPGDIVLRSDGPTLIRLERKGNNLQGKYSTDGGKNWITLKSWASEFSSKVQIGVIATNVSPKPLTARFEDYNPNAPPLPLK